MSVLGLGLMSSNDYEYKNFTQKSKNLAAPHQQNGNLVFHVDQDKHRPHATVIFVNTDKVDDFIREAAHIAAKTEPIEVTTTRHVLADDGMREEQNTKTPQLVKLQDLAIKLLVPLAKERGILPDGTRVIWPPENPPGKDLDKAIPKLPKDDPERQQYEAIGYDEADGDKHMLYNILAGKKRTDTELKDALTTNPFNRFRPHETEMRLKPNEVTENLKAKLSGPADGRTINYDLLVVSKRGPNGTFSKPIAAFDLKTHKQIDANASDAPLPVRFGTRKPFAH